MTMIITSKDRDENGKMTNDNDNDNHTHTKDNTRQKRHSNKTKIETQTLSTAKPRHTRNIVPFSHESIGCKCRKSSKLDKKETAFSCGEEPQLKNWELTQLTQKKD